MQNIFEIMKKYGFSENETKIYQTLLGNDFLTGYEAAKQSGVPRSKVYNVLANLIHKGLVMTNHTSNSTLYKAVSFEKVTALIKEEVLQDVEVLNREFQEDTKSFDNELIWNIEERELLQFKIKELIQKAKDNIFIQIWSSELSVELEQLIQSREKEGIHIAVVLYDERGNYQSSIKNIFAHGFEQDKLKELHDRWISISVDEREILYASIKNDKHISGVYTKNESMVFFLTEYILHDIYCLKLIEDLKEVDLEKSKKYINEIRRIFKNE